MIEAIFPAYPPVPPIEFGWSDFFIQIKAAKVGLNFRIDV